MERTQFTFYESFYKAVSRIKAASVRAQVYDIICAYALYGTEPDIDKLPEAAALALELIKPNLDASRRKAINGKAGGTAKKSEASRKQNESKPEANSKQTESKTEANVKQGETESKKENEKESKKENKKEKENECYKKTPTRFAPPSLEEVRAYILERNSSVDPQSFIDFYASKGWLVGKTPMKDWRAAVRTWERRDGNAETNNGVRSDSAGNAPQSSREWGIKYS